MENRSHFLPILFLFLFVLFYFCLCVIALDTSSGPRWPFSRQGFFFGCAERVCVCGREREGEREVNMFIDRSGCGKTCLCINHIISMEK